ncbi:MAG: AmmeMemoRadiSam system protein B [Anaerolineales bacterium]|nr:AmmeMemoRadiSam system protein B [Anaerolineales bacterium]
MSKRTMSVAGSFYPASCSEIERYIRTFNNAVEKEITLPFVPKAMIAPHAGYVYSGFTANSAYRLIDTSAIKKVVVIGPSHRVFINGASVATQDDYASPCGDLPIDRAYSRNLINRYDFLTFREDAHSEHSTETQVPFINHYFNDVKIVEIVYGDIVYQKLVPIIEEALRDEETFVVISTDLSHFYPLEEARKLDSICLKGVENLDIGILDAGCQACGIIGVKAMVQAAKNSGLKSRVIDYRTSYDASGDAGNVVGYLSALFG